MRLRQDITAAEAQVAAMVAPESGQWDERAQRSRFLAELRRRLDLEAELPEATPARLVALLRAETAEYPSMDGGSDVDSVLRQAEEPYDPLGLLVEELADRGAEGATAIRADLMARRVVESPPNDLFQGDKPQRITGDLHWPLLLALARCRDADGRAWLRERTLLEFRNTRWQLFRILAASHD